MSARKCSALAVAVIFSALAPMQASAPESPRDRAWDIIKANLNENDFEKRAIAARVLGLLLGDPQAEMLAEKAAGDDKPAVRAAAATALGELHDKSGTDRLHILLGDHEPSVMLAAAAALAPYKDPAAYNAYYEVLTGERKTGTGITEQAKADLDNPKKLAVMGFEEGIGFVPYAGIGWGAFEALHTDDASPIRSAAAKMLTNDPDPKSGKALVKVASDKSWQVRTAALDAIAKRGDPKLLDGIVPALLDDNTSVRCTASATVIRLLTLAANGKKAGAPRKSNSSK